MNIEIAIDASNIVMVAVLLATMITVVVVVVVRSTLGD